MKGDPTHLDAIIPQYLKRWPNCRLYYQPTTDAYTLTVVYFDMLDEWTYDLKTGKGYWHMGQRL
ncbi:hypothetical protein SBV1_1080017 [Verrucomicrobia bacterium]|nr:hypothetical protein SBV1_1080017 [Verrucomicrobiota bacterium]